MTKLIAGFECGFLDWNQHDLLLSTRHTTNTDLEIHYKIILDHGITWCRDGLVKGHNIFDKIKIANDMKVNCIYDLSHYHKYNDPEVFAFNIARKVYDLQGNDKEFWVCPANEPSIVPLIRFDMSSQEAIDIGYAMINVLKKYLNNVKILSVDVPGSDAFTDIADIIGINVYPHTIDRPINEYLIEAQQRFKKPVAISETSWHNGWHERDGIGNKADWLRYVIDEVKLAEDHGVDVPFICWYPFISCPPWEDPKASHFWDHGLLNFSGEIDEEFSEQIKLFTKENQT